MIAVFISGVLVGYRLHRHIARLEAIARAHSELLYQNR